MKRIISTILALTMVITMILGITPASAANEHGIMGSWRFATDPADNFPYDFGVITFKQDGNNIKGTCGNYPNSYFLISGLSNYDWAYVVAFYEDNKVIGVLDILNFSADGNSAKCGLRFGHDVDTFIQAPATLTRIGDATLTINPQPPEQPAQPIQPAQNQPAGESVLTGFTATPSKTSFLMNGAPVSVTQAYNINNNNYLQLRAIADLLNGTAAQFNVSWDGTYAVIETGKPYTDGPTSAAMKTTTNVKTSNTLFKLDGKLISFDNAYLIDGSINYLQLREVAKLLRGTASQFNIWWDSARSVALIEPGKTYTGGYQSPAFSVTPLDGVTISGEAGVMDKERVWTVREPSDSELSKALSALDDANTLVVAAYEIDAGLGVNEKLPGAAQIKFDLSRMEIPSAAYGDLRAYRVGSNGSVTELPSRVSGSALICESRQNSVIVIATAVIATMIGKEVTDTKKWGDLPAPISAGRETFNAFLGVEIRDSNNEARCKVYWSAASSPRFQAEVETMLDEFNTVKAAADAKYGDPSWNILKRKQKDQYILSELYTNTIYYEAKRNLLSKEWVYANCTTQAVKNAIDAVESAMKYLDYKLIDATSSVTDVLIKKNLGVLGASVNPPERAPYIEIDEAEANNRDNLFLTVAHEMLHVSQTAYTTVEWKSDVTFWEMTAVHFESNCRDDYRRDDKIKSLPQLTESDWHELLVTPMDATPSYGNDMDAIHHGYVYGRFLLFLEKNKGKSVETWKLLMSYRAERKASMAIRDALGLPAVEFDALFLEFIQSEQSLILSRSSSFKAPYTAMGVTPATLPKGGALDVKTAGGAYSAYAREITFADPSQPVTILVPQGLKMLLNGSWIGTGTTTFTPSVAKVTVIEVLTGPPLPYKLSQGGNQSLQSGSIKMQVELKDIYYYQQGDITLARVVFCFTGFNKADFEIPFTLWNGEPAISHYVWIELEHTRGDSRTGETEVRTTIEKLGIVDRSVHGDLGIYAFETEVYPPGLSGVVGGSTVTVKVYNYHRVSGEDVRGGLRATFTYTVPLG